MLCEGKLVDCGLLPDAGFFCDLNLGLVRDPNNPFKQVRGGEAFHPVNSLNNYQVQCFIRPL